MKWLKENKYTLRLDYDLNENSVVFDLGGYKGWFTDQISKKYNSNVYCFEPISEFANKIKNKFQDNNKVKVFTEGISNESKSAIIYINNDASSLNSTNGTPLSIKLTKMDLIMKEHNIEKIDLIKINIEGEEYSLMDYLIENKIHENIENIQVQFHRIGDNYQDRYNKIANNLEKTHKLTYFYPFVWENWKLK